MCIKIKALKKKRASCRVGFPQGKSETIKQSIPFSEMGLIKAKCWKGFTEPLKREIFFSSKEVEPETPYMQPYVVCFITVNSLPLWENTGVYLSTELRKVFS